MKKINKTQKKILNAAKEIYLEVGYTASTFQMIADRSDTSRSLINYYYPKKQDILVDLLGRYLGCIYDYIKDLKLYNSLMTYMLANTVYIKSMLSSEEIRTFYYDMLNRNDRDLGPYKNYDSLYGNIVCEFNINMSEEDLTHKEISIFGSQKELIINYLNKNLNISENGLIELVLRDVCSLLQLSNYVINNTLSGLWKEYELLEKKIVPLSECDLQ